MFSLRLVLKKHTNLLIALFFILFELFLFRANYQRVGVFSFGDEWNNFVAGFFMLRGKVLYNQIFFNHQVLPAYISYFIQLILHPKGLYLLVLYHRMFVFFFSAIFNGLLVYRFRFVGLAFIVVYELTKFYLFGNLFLAEALIVYPLVFLVGVVFETLLEKKISKTDLFLSAFFTWFVVFMREPFVPLAFFLFTTLCFRERRSRTTKLSLILFVVLCVLTVLSVSLGDFLFQVVFYNFTVVLPHESGEGILKIIQILFYPLFAIFDGKQNAFGQFLSILSGVYVVLLAVFAIGLKKIKQTIFIWIVLILLSLRYVKPGTNFFEAFHMVCFYGLFIFFIFLLLEFLYVQKKLKEVVYGSFVVLITAFLYLNISDNWFFFKKADTVYDFNTNYVHYARTGEAIKILKTKSATLFADFWDYLIYWVADIDSSYKYSVYTFTMKGYPLYDRTREEMFAKNPPDFYYTYCGKNVFSSPYLSNEQLSLYVQLKDNGKPACLYIKKTYIEKVNEKQWGEAKHLGFSK